MRSNQTDERYFMNGLSAQEVAIVAFIELDRDSKARELTSAEHSAWLLGQMAVDEATPETRERLRSIYGNR